MPDSANYVRVVNRPVTSCVMRDHQTNRPSSIESISAVTLTTQAHFLNAEAVMIACPGVAFTHQRMFR